MGEALMVFVIEIARRLFRRERDAQIARGECPPEPTSYELRRKAMILAARARQAQRAREYYEGQE